MHRYRPGHAGYVSEFTQFIEHYLDDHPDVRQDQKLGWRLWWERPVNFKELERAGQDSVPTPPYYYK